MNVRLRTMAATAPLALLLGTSGCASMGSLDQILGDLGGGLYGGDISGEVRQVDSRRQEIELTSGWGGSEWIRYDGRTEVIYRERRYDVRDLERGDQVRVRVDEGRRDRDRYASVIYVERSVDERRSDDRDYGRIERFDGRVREIDTREGWMEVEVDRSLVLVELGYDPSRDVRDRFRRLRRGDRVRMEVQQTSDYRFELRRFL